MLQVTRAVEVVSQLLHRLELWVLESGAQELLLSEIF